MDAGITIPGKLPKCARRDFNFKAENTPLKRRADSARLSYQETILACITRRCGRYFTTLSGYRAKFSIREYVASNDI